MKEYIERAAALDICQKEYEERLRMADYCGDTVAWNIGGAIKSLPAADVAEVRHGKWIPSDMGGGEPDEAYVCSECGEPWTLIDGNPAENNMRYCPACGARMDKEDEHETG